MKLMAVCALACGFVAALVMTAGAASGSPTCDGADCIPYVARDVEEGTTLYDTDPIHLWLRLIGQNVGVRGEEWMGTGPALDRCTHLEGALRWQQRYGAITRWRPVVLQSWGLDCRLHSRVLLSLPRLR